jgi:hypothetical protein
MRLCCIDMKSKQLTEKEEKEMRQTKEVLAVHQHEGSDSRCSEASGLLIFRIFSGTNVTDWHRLGLRCSLFDLLTLPDPLRPERHRLDIGSDTDAPSTYLPAWLETARLPLSPGGSPRRRAWTRARRVTWSSIRLDSPR